MSYLLIKLFFSIWLLEQKSSPSKKRSKRVMTIADKLKILELLDNKNPKKKQLDS